MYHADLDLTYSPVSWWAEWQGHLGKFHNDSPTGKNRSVRVVTLAFVIISQQGQILRDQHHLLLVQLCACHGQLQNMHQELARKKTAITRERGSLQQKLSFIGSRSVGAAVNSGQLRNFECSWMTARKSLRYRFYGAGLSYSNSDGRCICTRRKRDLSKWVVWDTASNLPQM